MLNISYIRDGLTEEFHEGILISAKPLKKSIPAYQDNVYYLRSCAKPLQAALLVDYGIDLTDEELAFCCGSHAGEECHVKIAKQLLNKFNLTERDLKCGIHSPLSKSMQKKMILNGENASQIHNNCSGKHIGFLSICRQNNWDLKEYDSPNHPLQIAVKNKIKELCELSRDYPMTTDGCGVPIMSMPLKNLATGYINLLKYPKIVNAIKNNPYIFGGEDRTDTEIIQKTENLIAKVGAGGLCTVLNFKEENSFVLKINDASTEARRFALLHIINYLGWGNIEFDNSIKTISGKIVGHINVKF